MLCGELREAPRYAGACTALVVALHFEVFAILRRASNPDKFSFNRDLITTNEIRRFAAASGAGHGHHSDRSILWRSTFSEKSTREYKPEMKLKEIAYGSKPRANVMFAVAVFFGAFVFLLATMGRSVDLYDEGIVLFGSVRVLSGDVPYRDFHTNYGPGQFYALAALFKLFGPSVIVERMWDLLVRSFTVGIIYQILQRTWNRNAALTASCVSTIWLAQFGFYGYPVFPCLLFSFLSIYCALPVFEGRHNYSSLLISGSCIGMVTLFRYDIGCIAAAGGAFLLGLFCLTHDQDKSHERKTLLRSEIAYIGGIVLVVAAALSMLLSAVSLHDILRDGLLSVVNYRRMRSLPFPSPIEIARNLFHLQVPADQMAVYAPVVTGFLGGIGATEPGVRESQRWVLAQLSILTLLFYLKGVVRVSLIHMALSLLPALVIMSVMIWQRRLRYYGANVLFLTVTVCLVIASLSFMRDASLRFRENIAWARNAPTWRASAVGHPRPNTDSCHPADGLERIRCFSIAQDELNAIHYIQQRSRENEYIYVGVPRHDKIFCNNILFYFASKRLAATKWHQLDPGVQTTAEIQTEMIADLQKREPHFVILNSDWDESQEPNESRLSTGVTLLDDFIRGNYYLASSFGTIAIYELRPKQK